MKIRADKSKVIYEVDIRKSGQSKLVCPACIGKRSNKKDKALSFNLGNGTGFCHYCNESFHSYYEDTSEKKTYTIPEWKNKTQLTEVSAKYFRSRGILDDVINEMKISSHISKSGNWVCFPYFKNGELVNIKYRHELEKKFMLEKGAELIFYNIDASLTNDEIIIVEGEFDCLSFMQAGFKNVISVPNGASATNMEYLDNAYDNFLNVKKFYIAVDNDAKGIELRNELVRRLGSERCCVVDFLDCKDANEYLQKYGAFDLGETLKNAKDVPVDGIIYCNNVSDNLYNLYLNGMQRGKEIMLTDFDNLITWETGRLAIFTGIPGHGKTEAVKFITTRLNMIYGWKAAYCSPESYPAHLFYSSFATTISGKSFKPAFLKQNEYEKTLGYIQDNFFLIYPEYDLSLDNILDRASWLVKKHGIKILVVDPYNKLEHMRERGESETEYISRFLDSLQKFAQHNDCLVILVAHPYKMKKTDDGSYEIPTLYDISGSSHFFNKADYGVIIYRNFKESTVLFMVQKVKFKHLGIGGATKFSFDVTNDRYFPENEPHEYTSYLNHNWHEPEEILNEELNVNEMFNNNEPF